MNKQDLRDIWQYVMLIAPAPIGALIGMRYAVDQTPKARAYTGPCSMGLGAFVGAGNHEQPGPRADPDGSRRPGRAPLDLPLHPTMEKTVKLAKHLPCGKCHVADRSAAGNRQHATHGGARRAAAHGRAA